MQTNYALILGASSKGELCPCCFINREPETGTLEIKEVQGRLVLVCTRMPDKHRRQCNAFEQQASMKEQ